MLQQLLLCFNHKFVVKANQLFKYPKTRRGINSAGIISAKFLCSITLTSAGGLEFRGLGQREVVDRSWCKTNFDIVVSAEVCPLQWPLKIYSRGGQNFLLTGHIQKIKTTAKFFGLFFLILSSKRGNLRCLSYKVMPINTVVHHYRLLYVSKFVFNCSIKFGRKCSVKLGIRCQLMPRTYRNWPNLEHFFIKLFG